MENVSKKSKELLPHIIPIRISETKFTEFKSLLASSRCRSMSEMLRKILDNRKIIIETRDITLQDITEELGLVRKEIHAIGVNINQVTRSFHSEKYPEQRLLQVMDITRLYQQTDQKVTRLFTIISKLAEQWSPK
ncbi:hypothetical protein AB6805_13860 [Chitinophaga sp. RCC_12]|uniref:plasmid mobilization protein n=1 Tax=Chitinophaga sp. RCC_12 TaxID=3239226 RepID=UPI0035266732